MNSYKISHNKGSQEVSPTSNTCTDELISLARVQRHSGLSKSTIYREIAKGAFPKQVRLSAGRVGWPLSEIEAWIAERCSARQVHRSGASHTQFRNDNHQPHR